MAHGVVDSWRGDDGRKRRGLLAGQIARGLAHVPARRRFHSEGPRSELDDVQIELEDAFLRELPFEPPGDEELTELAPRRPRGGEVEVLGELLRDRRTADLQ